METIFEILNKFGLNAVTKNFQNEKVDMKVVMPASDEDSIRLGVRTIGERIRLREACRRDYTANSLLRQLGIIQEISTDRPGLDERLFLFSPSFGRIMEVVRRREEKGAVVLLVAVIEWQQISVYNQLTSSSSGNSQLQNCGAFELMKCIPNCKVLELLECQISAEILKAAAGQSGQHKAPSQFYH